MATVYAQKAVSWFNKKFHPDVGSVIVINETGSVKMGAANRNSYTLTHMHFNYSNLIDVITTLFRDMSTSSARFSNS